jgi:hypothetical protein
MGISVGFGGSMPDSASTANMTIIGHIDRVIRADCTAADMVPVVPQGFGIGAGAFAATPDDALSIASDGTFLFDWLFASHLPLPTQVSLSAEEILSSQQRYFTPVMAFFSGGVPRIHWFRDGPALAQGHLLSDRIWPLFPDALAIGFVASATTQRAHLRGALMRRTIAKGSATLDDTETTVGSRLREQFFETDPMRYYPSSEELPLWYVGISINAHRLSESKHGWSSLSAAFYDSGQSELGGGLMHHCHGVLVPVVPPSWRADAWAKSTVEPRSWALLYAEAQESIASVHKRAFSLHLYDSCMLSPSLVAVWPYSELDTITYIGPSSEGSDSGTVANGHRR